MPNAECRVLSLATSRCGPLHLQLPVPTTAIARPHMLLAHQHTRPFPPSRRCQARARAQAQPQGQQAQPQGQRRQPAAGAGSRPRSSTLPPPSAQPRDAAPAPRVPAQQLLQFERNGFTVAKALLQQELVGSARAAVQQAVETDKLQALRQRVSSRAAARPGPGSAWGQGRLLSRGRRGRRSGRRAPPPALLRSGCCARALTQRASRTWVRRQRCSGGTAPTRWARQVPCTQRRQQAGGLAARGIRRPRVPLPQARPPCRNQPPRAGGLPAVLQPAQELARHLAAG
jgi:hypothetical protein